MLTLGAISVSSFKAEQHQEA